METLRTVHLDSAKLRCLAHPLRSRLLAALRVHGPATSAALADRLDTNTGATSYHLRKLAEVELIEEVPERGTARERWWQAAHDATSWTETEFLDDPDDRAAADWLYGAHHRMKSLWIQDWLDARDGWPTAWREAAESADIGLPLTAAQAKAMNQEIQEVVERYRVEGPADGDVQRVVVLLDIFPQPEPSL